MQLLFSRAVKYSTILLILFISMVSYADQQTLDAIKMQRTGLSNLITYMDNEPDIFDRPPEADLVFNREQKQKALDVWVLFLDYMSTLDALADKTRSKPFMQAASNDHQTLFLLAYTAHYRYGLEFIARTKNDAELGKWLNLQHANKDLPKNFYQRFSNEILSDFTTDRFDNYVLARNVVAPSAVTAMIDEDKQAIADLNRFSLLTSNSAGRIRRTLYNTYFPVQKGVARGMGKVKVWRIGQTLITPEQALDFSRTFEPGDFYLTRKEWRLTNVGIPGFWTHSAMFIGTPAERALYFNTPEINEWVASMGANTYEELLQQTSPIYAAQPGYDDLGDIRVIEALDAGVIFNSIETSLAADGAAVFRPLTSRLEKAKAIHAAFYYTGQPYDFKFDFDSDNAMVCSELIYKAYQPSSTQEGIEFPLNRAVGNKMLTPSEIAQWFDETVDTPDQKIELVMFIDSNEKDKVAFQSTKEAFIGSWKRPDWYIFKQPRRPDDRIATTGE